MQQLQERGYPRARSPRGREAWSEEDYRALRSYARGGDSLGLISRRLGRSADAVTAVARRLGVVILAERCKVPAVATPDEARARLRELTSENSASLAALSRMIRRHKGYLWAFLNEGTPHVLSPANTKLLAAYFDIPATDLGGEPVALPLGKSAGQARAQKRARMCDWGA